MYSSVRRTAPDDAYILTSILARERGEGEGEPWRGFLHRSSTFWTAFRAKPGVPPAAELFILNL